MDALSRSCRQLVTATPERAFETFTLGFFSWWPRHHHLSDLPSQDVWIEPWVGGRWLELDQSGHMFKWGDVAHWAPGARLELSVGVNADYDYVAPPGAATTLVVEFSSVSTHECQVDLRHSGFEAHGPEDALRLLADIDEVDYWPDVLRHFAAKLAPDPQQ